MSLYFAKFRSLSTNTSVFDSLRRHLFFLSFFLFRFLFRSFSPFASPFLSLRRRILFVGSFTKGSLLFSYTYSLIVASIGKQQSFFVLDLRVLSVQVSNGQACGALWPPQSDNRWSGWYLPEHIHTKSSREYGMTAYVRGAFEYLCRVFI
ncbi:hypothetical protein HDK64DRAFT_277526 [Phyllosticta capitalensis]